MSPGTLEPFQSPPQEQICVMVCICATAKMDTAQEPLIITQRPAHYQARRQHTRSSSSMKEERGWPRVVVSRLDLEFYAIPSGTVAPH